MIIMITTLHIYYITIFALEPPEEIWSAPNLKLQTHFWLLQHESNRGNNTSNVLITNIAIKLTKEVILPFIVVISPSFQHKHRALVLGFIPSLIILRHDNRESLSGKIQHTWYREPRWEDRYREQTERLVQPDRVVGGRQRWVIVKPRIGSCPASLITD